MPQQCKVCVHPKRDAINRELLEATSTGSAVAERYGLTTAAVNRHKHNHLTVSSALVSEQKNALQIVAYASDLYDRAAGILKRAEALLAEDADSRSVQAAASAVRELRQTIELLAKLVVAAPQQDKGEENSWLDAAIAERLAELSPPELPAGHRAVEADVVDAEIVDLPE